MNGDWTQAIEIYSRLQQSYPDNLDYGLEPRPRARLVGQQRLKQQRRLPFCESHRCSDRDDPRIDLTEARIAARAWRLQTRTSGGRECGRKSERIGARLLLARAKLHEGYASDDLGDFRGALDDYAVAKRTFEEYGNLDDSAVAVMSIGGVLLKQGDLPAPNELSCKR